MSAHILVPFGPLKINSSGIRAVRDHDAKAASFGLRSIDKSRAKRSGRGDGVLIRKVVFSEVRWCAEKKFKPFFASLHRLEQALIDRSSDDGIEHIQGHIGAVLSQLTGERPETVDSANALSICAGFQTRS